MQLLNPTAIISRTTQSLQERMKAFLVDSDKKSFVYTASLVGSLVLAGTAFVKFKNVSNNIDNKVMSGRLDPFLANMVKKQYAFNVLNKAVLGAAIGAGAGSIAFNKFHQGVDIYGTE